MAMADPHPLSRRHELCCFKWEQIVEGDAGDHGGWRQDGALRGLQPIGVVLLRPTAAAGAPLLFNTVLFLATTRLKFHDLKRLYDLMRTERTVTTGAC